MVAVVGYDLKRDSVQNYYKPENVGTRTSCARRQRESASVAHIHMSPTETGSSQHAPVVCQRKTHLISSFIANVWNSARAQIVKQQSWMEKTI